MPWTNTADGHLIGLKYAYDFILILYNRPEIIELMDPHYILVNWGTVAPKPIADWNLTQAIIGARIPVPLPNASEVYALQSHDDAVLVQGNITTSFAGVHVFVVDSPHPLVSHVR